MSEPGEGGGPQPPSVAAAGLGGAIVPQGPPRRGTFATWGPATALAGLAGALVAGLILGIPAVLIDDNPSGQDLSTGAQIAAQVATVIGFIGAALFVSAQDGGPLRAILERLGVRRFAPSAVGWMGVAVAAYLAFAAIYANLITVPKQDDIASSFGPVWVQVILIVVAAASSEEFCFRGMLFGGLRKGMPLWAAVVISGLVFGGLHALTGVTAVPPLMVFGMILALLYDRTGSILPGMILHALNNTVALLGQ